jgi:hypothetical protein
MEKGIFRSDCLEELDDVPEAHDAVVVVIVQFGVLGHRFRSEVIEERDNVSEALDAVPVDVFVLAVAVEV